MLGILFSKAGLILMAVGIVGAVVFVQYRIIQNLRDRLTTLDIQATALEQANTSMRSDIAAIQKLQQQANQSLSNIRLGAAQSAQTVQNRQFKGDHSQIQQQVNQETAAVFGRLQDLSRAP